MKKKKLYVISDKPSLFVKQEYCKEIIDLNTLSGGGEYDQSFIFKKFKKIHTLYWQTESHLKGTNTIVENYCDQLKVKRVKYPYFKIDKKDFKFNNKPYILVSLKNPTSKDNTNATLKIQAPTTETIILQIKLITKF